ncbi:unnamed protein product [Fasciola hepatica]|uniref:Uncharacterized protein n=1 Tax=Fasciola hepatica TaxID=6192 RepID=A0ABC9HF16_FASHE|nr:unnamed protein product [Fasciola hepatica]
MTLQSWYRWERVGSNCIHLLGYIKVQSGCNNVISEHGVVFDADHRNHVDVFWPLSTRAVHSIEKGIRSEAAERDRRARSRASSSLAARRFTVSSACIRAILFRFRSLTGTWSSSFRFALIPWNATLHGEQMSIETECAELIC